MDPRLAEIYGTNEDIGDVEKTAAAELAEQLAEENGMDIDNMTAEDIEALAAEVLSDGADDSDESGEKLAEADYIGRVMAHAYVQELREIEKTAAYSPSKKEMAKGQRMAKATGEGMLGRLKRRAHYGVHSAGKALSSGKKKAVELAMKHPKSAIGLGALAAGGAGFAAGRKTKKSSATPALDALAQARAEELLAESGAGGDQWDALSSAVDQRALEMLAEAGYDVE